MNYAAYLTQPTTVTHLLDPDSPTPAGLREYLLGIGIKSGLIIPLISRGQAHGLFSVYFDGERHFDPEEIEIARALATQASLAVQLTRLAKTARQSAILEERNRLAGEIHDSLAQFFAGISLQLFAAQEAITKADDSFNYVERAYDLAQVGLGEIIKQAIGVELERRDPARAFLYRQISALNVGVPPDLLEVLFAARHNPDVVVKRHIPTILIVGEEDVLTPPSIMELMRRRLGPARLIRIPGSGHSVYFERPDEFNRTIENFLREALG